MKLFHSATSPFVRQCVVCAHELGLLGHMELVPAAAHPVKRDVTLAASNPLGKVPTLIADDGMVLHDSRVICEYLNSRGGGRLLPVQGTIRWRVLVDQSLADGLLDAAVLARYETAVRPENLRWNDWTAGQLAKVTGALDEFERLAAGFGERVDLGTIAVGCALGYLDFRYASLGWRERHPQLARWFAAFGARPSMAASTPS